MSHSNKSLANKNLANKNLATHLLAAALGLTALGISASANAAPAKSDPAPNRSCFFSSSWHGWRSPSPDVIYLRVNVNDIYKVDLSVGSHLLMWPDSHLINQIRGSNTICSGLDLDLSVSDNGGFREPLIAKSLVKLTPDEVAAIPKKYLP
jgi:hypothetical protein